MTSENPQLLALYNRSTADLGQLTDTTYIRRWESIAFAYNNASMKEENISYVLAARIIPVAHLEVVDSVAGGGYIHKRIAN